MAEKQTILPFHMNREKKTILTSLNKRYIALTIIAFLLGRAGILQGLTPFGIGFVAALSHKDRKYGFTAIATLLGITTVQGVFGSIPYAITLGIIYLLFHYVMDLRKVNILKAAFMSGFAYLTVGTIALSFGTFYLYDVTMLAFEALVIFVIVYISSYALPMIIQKTSRRILSTEEIICIAILAALVLSGFNEVYLFNISLKNSLAVLLTIIFAYNGGTAIGATVGITLGLITSMSMVGTPPVIIGIFGFSGLLAGIFKDLGKVGSGIGFVMGTAILTFYISGYYEVFIEFTEVFLAFGLFLFLPAAWIMEMEKFCNSPKSILASDQTHSQRMKKMTYEKLMDFSSTFEELSVTFDRISDKFAMFENEDLSNLIQEVANHACESCGMRRSCWENNFLNTYQSMSDLLYLIEVKDNIPNDSLPEEIQKRCIHPKKVVEKMKHLYELAHLDMTWQEKLIEGRYLVGQQLKGVSKVIGQMAKDINGSLTFDLDLEGEIYVALDKAGLMAKNVMVTHDSEKNIEVIIEKNPCFNRESCINSFLPVISEAVGTKLVKKPTTCSYKTEGEGCSFALVEANRYQAVTKVATMTKEGNLHSGDTYTFMDIKDNQYMMALSDGMGAGEKAHKQSSATIAMLEKMMEAGFDREVAIQTINSMLMLKSSEEIFSSLDMTLMDLCKGKADFVKIGSAPSFIKKGKDEVQTISSSTLPIGILKDIEFNGDVHKIEDGDFIITVSDGILEADKERGEEWLIDFLSETHTRNPQDLADKILQKSLNLSDNRAQDDMTVMITKIWKVTS
ncbi:MAG: stage II sporulation protein E [Clostridiaceae bacterium]|nr:stage II sporulation protein E [Clostridiaceae bacterium]